jgi:hypothetical protein
VKLSGGSGVSPCQQIQIGGRRFSKKDEETMNTPKKMASLFSAAVLTLTLALPAAAANGAPAPKPSPTPAAKPAPVPPEKHPKIREALAALRSSREDLEHAAHDFGGHRVEAMHAIDEAIKQLEICLKYDKD